MRTIDLFTVNPPNVECVWAQEKCRTFRCSCGNEWTIPKDAVLWNGKKDEDGSSFCLDHAKLDFHCQKCGKAKGEAAAFLNRYDLLEPIKAEPRKKKQVQRGFQFEGYIGDNRD